jgi:hypothetical protein
MYWTKVVVSAVAGALLSLLLPTLWAIPIMIRTTKEQASGIGFDVVGLFERVHSPWFWILAALFFASLFAASQLGNKVLRLFLFWIPSVLLTTLGVMLSGLTVLAYAYLRSKGH